MGAALTEDYFFPENTLHQPVTNMENLNKPNEIEFLLKKLIDNIRRIEMYTPGGPLEDKKNKVSHALFREQQKINRELQEEKSEPHRTANARGINNQLNV